MGVYIKDMEMPTTGLYFVSVDNTSGRDKTVVTVERMLGNRDVRQIIGSFELIPVPPHGRCIDADEMVASVKRQTKIMREIAKEVDKLKPIANSKELDDVDIVAIVETVEKGVLQEIANAPTILEAEVEK